VNPSSQALVSIITIFLNAERFLEEAAESVFAQTYSHWEYLLVDDGSSDRSVEIARSLAARHPDRVRYLEHPNRENRGLSASRNLGVREARGEFVCFLDADDVYVPGKLQDQVRLLQEHPSAAMVYGVTEHWFSWTGRPEDARRDQPKRLGVPPDSLVEPPTLVPLYLTGEAQTPGTSGFLVRREALLRVGGFEEQFRTMSEDKVFFTKVGLQYPIFVASGKWDRYRQHDESLSNEMRRAGQYRASAPSNSQKAYLVWLREHLDTHGIDDTAVKTALEQAWKPYSNRFTFAVHIALYRARRALARLGVLPSQR
jgi:glycosyltransferase involved in cell wall biosynthesis